ncbi:MAG: DUF4058 family protein [Planctomycetes bacterium]|nr:DUF4058 family protein [Planctomycetota bacterium]
MPIHDWTRVTAGVFHDFQNAWITELRNALNGGVLPERYYALGEQRAGEIGPDVLALHVDDSEDAGAPSSGSEDDRGMVAVAEVPPRVSISQEAVDAAYYASMQRSIVVRHATGDRIVAMIEIVSPANKHGRDPVQEFVRKVTAALREGVHVMVIDPLPPTRHDPAGMHEAIWATVAAMDYEPPEGMPLTLASYCAREMIGAYVEPIQVGSVLIDMPLFLTRDHYVNTPLENTYMAAWQGVPHRWRRVIEAAKRA